MSRYIVRSKENTNKHISAQEISDTPHPELFCPSMSYDETIMLMRELFKYRDDIDYNSYIYIITTTHKNGLRIIYDEKKTISVQHMSSNTK